jgi:GNAT superfamily N-acetyltransferase
MARMVEPVRPGATIQHAAPAALAYSAQEVENLLGDVDEDELREMIRNRQVFIVRTGGRVVGLAGWKGPYLRHVYVDPGHTRRGIGTMLLSRVEADFRSHRSGRDQGRRRPAGRALLPGQRLRARRAGEGLGRQRIPVDGQTAVTTRPGRGSRRKERE